MSDPVRLLDCQSGHGFEPVDPDNERVTFWIDEHGETQGTRRSPRSACWHSVREFVLALAEAALLLVVVIVIVALFYVVFG